MLEGEMHDTVTSPPRCSVWGKKLLRLPPDHQVLQVIDGVVDHLRAAAVFQVLEKGGQWSCQLVVYWVCRNGDQESCWLLMSFRCGGRAARTSLSSWGCPVAGEVQSKIPLAAKVLQVSGKGLCWRYLHVYSLKRVAYNFLFGCTLILF